MKVVCVLYQRKTAHLCVLPRIATGNSDLSLFTMYLMMIKRGIKGTMASGIRMLMKSMDLQEQAAAAALSRIKLLQTWK